MCPHLPRVARSRTRRDPVRKVGHTSGDACTRCARDHPHGLARPEPAGGSQRLISMTTHSAPGRHATFLRAGCDRKTSGWASVVTGFVALWVAAATGLLYFDNMASPLHEYPRLVGKLAGLGCGSLAGASVFTLTWWVARRSRVLLVVLVGAVCMSGWVLLPRQVDVSESWVPQVNPRWACTGWSFRHYPPDTSDASDTIYCVGLETRIADG